MVINGCAVSGFISWEGKQKWPRLFLEGEVLKLSLLLTGRTTGMATPAHKEAEEATGALFPPLGLGLCYRREQSGWRVGSEQSPPWNMAMMERHLPSRSSQSCGWTCELLISLTGPSTACVRAVKRYLCPTSGEGAEVPRTWGSRSRGRVAGLPGGDD